MKTYIRIPFKDETWDGNEHTRQVENDGTCEGSLILDMSSGSAVGS